MKRIVGFSMGVFLFCLVASLGFAQQPAAPTQPPAAPTTPPKPPDYPPFADVTKDYEKVVSTMDGSPGAPSMYTLWWRKKDHQLLAE